MEITLAILIAVAGAYILYKAFAFLKKRGVFKAEKKEKIKKEKTKKEEKQKKYKSASQIVGGVTVVEKYMYRREVKALIALNRVLPKEYIALPKVGIANVLEPVGSRNLYNEVKGYFVDFVIFEETTMRPKLVVDIYDNSFEDEFLKHRHPLLMEILDDLKIGVLEVLVRGEIDLVALKELLAKHLGIVEEEID